MFTLSLTRHFDAAHCLPGHPGKCANKHGHRWNVTLRLSVDKLRANAMVCDFGDLKKALDALLEQFDHHDLNADLGIRNPTAENLAQEIYRRLRTVIPEMLSKDQCYLVEVDVEESPGCSVAYDGAEPGCKPAARKGKLQVP